MKRFVRIDLEYELDDDPLYLASDKVKRLLTENGYKILNTRDTSKISELNNPFYKRD